MSSRWRTSPPYPVQKSWRKCCISAALPQPCWSCCDCSFLFINANKKSQFWQWIKNKSPHLNIYRMKWTQSFLPLYNETWPILILTFYHRPSIGWRPIQGVPHLTPLWQLGWAPAHPCDPRVDKAGIRDDWPLSLHQVGEFLSLKMIFWHCCKESLGDNEI